jgi:hypothetical protein
MSDQRLRFCFKVISLPVLAVLLASYWFLHSVPVEAQVSQNSKVHDLQEQRLATLRDLVTLMRNNYKNGDVSYDDLLNTTRARDEAELALSTSNKERIAILEKIVTAAKEEEEQAAQLAANNLLARRLLLQAKANLLQQEIYLEQARAQ